MNKVIILFVSIFCLIGCISIGGGNRFYLTSESREGEYTFRILTPPTGSITLPGDPNAWIHLGTQAGWHTFKNNINNDKVQYAKAAKSFFEFYTDDLDTNEKYIDKYYEWESEYFIGNQVVDTVQIIKKEIDEDNEDYILIDVTRNDKISHYIYFSIQNGFVVGVSLRSTDPKDVTLYKIEEIYASTKLNR